jgi:hypothetical protein
MTHVVLEVGDQPFETHKYVALFSAAIVPMLTFAGLIVVADDPLTGTPIEQRVL